MALCINYPDWKYPECNVEWLGLWGINDPLDSFIILNGVNIPWNSRKVPFFSTQDYGKCNMSYLKSIAQGRRMAETKLRKKSELISALERWDKHFNNTTPVIY